MKKSIGIKREDIVNHYTDLSEMFTDHMPEYLETLSADQKEYLSGMLDFEGYSFLVINGDTVVIMIDDEITSIETLSECAELTTEYIKENIEQ